MLLEVSHVLDLKVDVTQRLVVAPAPDVRSLHHRDNVLEHYLVAGDGALELLLI